MQSACPALVPEAIGESPLRPAPRPAGPAPRRNPESTPRSRLCSFPLVAFVGVSLFGVLFLLQFARIVQVQYDLAAQTRVRDRLAHENAELQLGIEQLSALNRVEQQARILGMVHPEGWQLLELPRLARQGLDGKVASAHSPQVPR